ncbi:hypothetical protein PG996_009084 [Apiospora saccharicola]|uniref:F-box domain-containing protein n=1 Tax=Apiospora saccharicola TaxID=335842 RepID=A0ABR1UJT2_9PEZI
MTHSYFERLPPELLIPILNNLSGLECLDSIMQASPAAYRVFDTHYGEIFEPLLSSGDIHQFTVSLIRITAYLRTSSLPPHFHDLFSLRSCLAGETTTYKWDPPRWEHPPCPLPPEIPATTLRGILASHRKVVSLTVGCLDHYLDLFHALKPEHPVDKSFHFCHEEGEGKYDYVGAWQLSPPCEPFPVRDMGPPTWVEEQRAMRAFWRLELFRTARAAIEAGRLSWPADSETSERQVREMGTDPFTFYDITAGAWLSSFYSRYPLGHEVGNNWPRIRFELERDLDAEIMLTVQAYMAENRQSIAEHDFLARARRRWPAPAPEGPQDSEVLGIIWGVLRFYWDISGGVHHWEWPVSPIKHVSFEPFRVVGFAVWSEARMHAAGFLEHDMDCCQAAWRSILTPEMLDEVAREKVRHHVSDSEETDSDASENPGETVLPRWVVRSGLFTYTDRKRSRRRRSRVRAGEGTVS